MAAEPDIARIARTLGDASRIQMLALLMDGRALTGKELAYGVGVSPATGTVHLQRLEADGLLSVATQGRHKYFRLSSPQVARCVEALMAVAPRTRTVATGPADSPLREARMCYDHLAGKLGRQLIETLLVERWLKPEGEEYEVTRRGEGALATFGLDLPAVRRSRRRFACGCLDWSERKDHLGGALGAALAGRMLEAGWIRRVPESRCVSVTPAGRRALREQLRLDWPALSDAHSNSSKPAFSRSGSTGSAERMRKASSRLKPSALRASR